MDNASYTIFYAIFYAIPSAPGEDSAALNWQLSQKLPSLAVALTDAAEIRTKRMRKQKTDRQDARLILQLLLEDRFPHAATALASAPHGAGPHPDHEPAAGRKRRR